MRALLLLAFINIYKGILEGPGREGRKLVSSELLLPSDLTELSAHVAYNTYKCGLAQRYADLGCTILTEKHLG